MTRCLYADERGLVPANFSDLIELGANGKMSKDDSTNAPLIFCTLRFKQDDSSDVARRGYICLALTFRSDLSERFFICSYAQKNYILNYVFNYVIR